MIDKIVEPRAVKAGDLLERSLILRSYHEQQRRLGLLLLGNWKHILKGTFSLRHNYIISVVVPEASLCCCALQNTQFYNLYKFQPCTSLPQFPLKLIFKGRGREGGNHGIDYRGYHYWSYVKVRPLINYWKRELNTLCWPAACSYEICQIQLFCSWLKTLTLVRYFLSWSVEKHLRRLSTCRIGWHCHLCLPGGKKYNSNVDGIVNLKDILDF